MASPETVASGPWSRSSAALRRLFWIALLAGGGALGIFYLSAHEAGRALRALYVNFLFFTSLAGGLVAWSAILRLSKAQWAGQLEKPLLCGVAFAVPSLIALGGLWIGNPWFAPWAAGKFPPGAWLAPSFIFGRDTGLLVIFWALTWVYALRRMKGHGHRTSALVALSFFFVFSMLGFDLVMGFSPPWYSTIIGMYFVASSLYIAVVCWTLLTILGGKASKEQLHDLGKLLLGISLVTVYFMYSQVLTQWYEDLPHEVPFMLQRSGSVSWTVISYVLIGVVYLGPLVSLLTVWSKRNAWYLGTVAAIVLVGLWLERYWLVNPPLLKRPQIGILEVAITAAFVGITGIAFELFGYWAPAQLPQRGSGE